MINNKPSTLAEIRFQISSCFREAERLIDFLQQEVAILNNKLSELEKNDDSVKAD